jgi:DNA-binding transcriptional MerR regulator/methylmalonyl-CoA mutase cobalamin-binding subunit
VTPSSTQPTTDTPLFTAGEVEERTGVPATTLRQWERRYGLPNPQRSQSGYRLYSQNDLDVIEFFKARISEGISVSRAAQLYSLEQSLPSAQRETGKAVLPHPKVQSLETMVAQLVDSTISGDSLKADKILAQAYGTMPVEDVVLELIQPTLVEVGERWHRGEITIAHEHQATHYLRGKLHHLLELAGSPRHGPTVILACPPGEWHEIGALSIAIFLRRAGVRTHYLGANTPIIDLARFAREVKASAIMLSATSPEVIDALRPNAHLLREVVPLVVYGGMAFVQNPALAAELGGQYAGDNAAQALDFILAQFEDNLPARNQA